ncbi:MAG TPA: hypothetical protein EYP11_03555 [Aquificaceae bacterium]|nr:hypothetical protein [Aquificaceae bacterium]
MASPLGKCKITLGTWRVLELEDAYLEESEEIGDTEVETKSWEPIQGKPCEDLNVIFVDGVRRTESFIYVEDSEGNLSEGFFVSVGAGALYMKYGCANLSPESFRNLTVKRFLVVRRGLGIGEGTFSVKVGGSVVEFEIKEADREPSPFINELMAKMEAEVAERTYRERRPLLVITDGTLHYSAKLRKLPFVGYVKRHRKLYVPAEKTYIFRELKIGQRTPLILIHSQPTMEGEGAKGFDKYGWYVRVSEDEGMGGIARLEVSADIGPERAGEIASLSAWAVPLFASTSFTDRRAPQNLLPIKHLENVLRKRLGSHTLIRRAIFKEVLATVSS